MKKASQLKAEARAALSSSGMRKTTLLFLLAIIGIGIVAIIGMSILMLIPIIGVLIFVVLYFGLFFFIIELTYKYNAACLDIAHGERKTLRDIFDFSGNDSHTRSFLGLFIPGLVIFLLACATIIPCIFIFKDRVYEFIMSFSNPESLDLVSFLPFTIIMMIFSIILMIPAYIYFYACSLTPFLAHDNSQMGIFACVKKSIVTMKGNKLRLMVLDLTFIGWYALGYLCAYIPILLGKIGISSLLGVIIYLVANIAIMCHVYPYWTISRANFYKDLTDANNIVQDVLDDPEDNDNEALDKILRNS